MSGSDPEPLMETPSARSRRDRVLWFLGAVIQVAVLGTLLAFAILALLNHGTAAMHLRYQDY